ncbi:MAG: cytochrome c peroxidase [Polyangiales bacterium]
MSPSRALPFALVATLAACGSSTVTPAAPDASADRAIAPDVAADVAPDLAPDVPSRCPDGAPPYPAAQPPVRAYAPLPDLRFEGASGEVALRDWYAPCADAPALLLVRTLAAWSGPSQHAAAHTRRVFEHPQGARVALVDLLVLGPDDTPAAPADLPAWRARYDAAPAALAVDPAYTFATLYGDAGELPLYAAVDPRTMRVLATVTRPSRAALARVITDALAQVDGAPRSTRFPDERLVDDRLTEDEWEMVQAMAGPPAPPPDPTNRVADDPRAARLGEALFHDAGLSSNGRVSCASCHDAARGYADGLPRAVGFEPGDRNTPSVLGAANARWLFVDGRVDTLWAQAVGPIENPLEMASTRLATAHRVAARYAADYAALFGPLPPLDDAARFPPAGAPGQPAWEAMRADDREAVDRVFVNAGKAIAAYERTLRHAPSALDRYAAGDFNALTELQRDGLQFFFTNGCAQCHHGPLLTDGAFHNIGMPTGRRDGAPDRGRADAIAQLERSPFRSDGPFSDDRTPGAHLARAQADAMQLGQFRTPSLRGVSRTGPWGHGGTFATLPLVVRHYAVGLQERPLAGTTGTRDLHLPWFNLDAQMLAAMVSLLEAL